MALHPAPPAQGGSDDPRVFLDRLSGNWRYEDDEGDEWEWQPFVQLARPAVDQGEVEDDAPSTDTAPAASTSTQTTGHWVKVLDDDLVRAQQAAYSVDGVDESQPAQPVLRRTKKRAASPSDPNSSSSTSALPPSKRPKPITSLYVSGLPLDATSDEIARVFSRYGVLLEDDQGKPRVKMYHDDKTGMFRGEALVVYFKPESVELAINMLDETNMRAAIGQTSSSGPIMRVQRAQFPTESAPGTKSKTPVNASTKSISNGPPGSDREEAGKGAQSAGQRRNLSEQDRKKIAKRVARLENKLSDWRDDSDESDDAHPSTTSTSNTNATSDAGRTVVLTKMFTLFELEQDPTLLLDLKDDVREECTDKIGGVTNVVLWDLEPEGIMTVRFSSHDQAQKCVQMMDGRFFAQRRINAFILNAKPRFRKSTTHPDDDDDNLAKHNFAQWLEKST
jgi:HIV Tat-specific factor 1